MALKSSLPSARASYPGLAAQEEGTPSPLPFLGGSQPTPGGCGVALVLMAESPFCGVLRCWGVSARRDAAGGRWVGMVLFPPLQFPHG